MLDISIFILSQKDNFTQFFLKLMDIYLCLSVLVSDLVYLFEQSHILKLYFITINKTVHFFRCWATVLLFNKYRPY